MCRVVTAEFPPLVSSSALARRWVAEHLQRWGLAELVEVATLLTSELVTNAIVHTGQGPKAVLAVSGGTMEVGVGDGERRFHRPVPPSQGAGGRTRDQPPGRDLGTGPGAPLVESGRGLEIVEALADEWGTNTLAEGKAVWFRLSTANWPHRSECRCDADDTGRALLASGRYVLAMPGPWD